MSGLQLSGIADQVVAVADSNLEAYGAWNGADGDYWTEHEQLFDAAVAEYDAAFFAAAAIRPGDRVLDVGCGTGRTTRVAASLCAPGTTLGVDLSARMLERARRRAADERLTNARFQQADAQIAAFPPGGYDVAISRTGAMFFGEPVAAFANIARALSPGGRVVLLAWQRLPDNEWISEFLAAVAAGRALPVPPPDAPSPFALADPERVQQLLHTAGFDDVSAEAQHRPMYFGRDAGEAYDFVRGLGLIDYLLRDLDETTRADAERRLRAGIEAHEFATGVRYPSAAWLITARKA